jgi:hypothetical protein
MVIYTPNNNPSDMRQIHWTFTEALAAGALKYTLYTS